MEVLFMNTQQTITYHLFHATKESLAQGKFLSVTMDYLGSIVANSLAQVVELSKKQLKSPLKTNDVILVENNFYLIEGKEFKLIHTLEEE